MWYPARVTVPADGEPVSSDEVKGQIRVDYADDDGLIDRLIAAARAYVEKYCGPRLATQTISISADGFSDLVRFPEAPVQSITSISYVDVDGISQILPTSVYEVRADGLDVSIVLKYSQHWPPIRPTTRITVAAVVGYDTVPPDVKHAILLLICHWYENREAVQVAVSRAVPEVMPMGVESLLCNHRLGV